jgi:hypothetical protein
MPAYLKVNTLLSGALAAALYLFFMFAKHDPMLSAVVPFLNDPYDAVGSFAAISSVLLVMIALVRAFRPYRTPSTETQKVYLIRTHMAIALAALITLVADGVAMVRHSSLWLETRFAGELLALLGGMTVGVVVATYLIRRTLSGIKLPTRARWKGAGAVSLLAILILAVYPENLIGDTSGHLFTIFVGMLLLFAPMAALDTALVPFAVERTTVVRARRHTVYPWILVLLFAFGIGVLAFLGETSEGGGRGVPLARVALVFAIFVGTGTLGVLIGYAFLRKPLGLL